MDLRRTIRELQNEKRRLDLAIETLEQLLGGAQPDPSGRGFMTRSRRGRKSMGDEERQQVSERMARYWAARRAASMAGQAQAAAAGAGDGHPALSLAEPERQPTS